MIISMISIVEMIFHDIMNGIIFHYIDEISLIEIFKMINLQLHFYKIDYILVFLSNSLINQW